MAKIFDANGNQLFAGAIAVKVAVKRDSRMMEHPVETGSTIVDHMVVMPIELEVSLMLPRKVYGALYASLAAAFLAGRLLTVQTRAATYDRMAICRLPHEESPDQFDVLAVGVGLKEVRLVQPTYTTIKPKKAVHSGTKKRGEVQPTDASKGAGSGSGGGSVLGKSYAGLKDWAAGFFGK